METPPESRLLKRLARINFILILLCFLAGLSITIWPGLGARIAHPMRQIIGNQRVAQLETILFTVQDTIQKGSYGLGLSEPEAPWQITPLPPPTPTDLPPTPDPTRAEPTPLPEQAPENQDQTPVQVTGQPSPTPTITAAPSATPSPTPTPWTLPVVPAFTELQGEGIWQPYLYDQTAQPVAVRTFLLPDPERPYATVAVIAFDLTRTDLHYILGLEEPKLPDGPGGPGIIPAADKQPDHLLAAFNGGFMATHGEYGAMSNGIVALPAKKDYGTIAILESGEVQIGEWGNDISPDEQFIAWRQNARMVVHNGQINDRVYNGSIITWGGNINGDILTWRSGIGLSADRQTLYYFAGPSISMPTLAQAMMAADVHNGILLDINASWVHFTAFRPAADSLTAEPLFEEGMETLVDRYLIQSKRDFFYITTK